MADQAGGDDDQDFPSTLPGTVIAGKYRLDGMIGRGGMGSVWSTMHLGLGQRVAVKLIAKRYAGSREARQRFEIEAKAAAQLRSRHVVQVFDNGVTEDGTPYIVMEMLEGESLDHRIERLGPIPIDQMLRIVSQVGKALGRAHAVGIVHRDLKPENIFLTRSDEDDGGEITKVLDFGIAKMKTTDGGGSATRTGTVLGTPLFMSPEQARGLKSVDHRTDLYSLAMVTFTMLTGQNAFSGESFGDILVAICTTPVPSLSVYAPGLPPSLDAWMQRASAKEPDHRFASVEAMIDALYTAAGAPRATGAHPEMRAPLPSAPQYQQAAPYQQSGPQYQQSAPQYQQSAPQHAPSGIGQPTQRSGDSSGTGIPATQFMTHLVSNEQRTTAAISMGRPERAVTGADIPKRSALPMVLIGITALALGGTGAFFLSGDSSPSPSAAATPSAAMPSAAAAPTGVPAVTAMPSKPSVEAIKADAGTSATAAPAAPPKTVPAPSPARPTEAPRPAPKPETRPSNPKPRAPDLGF